MARYDPTINYQTEIDAALSAGAFDAANKLAEERAYKIKDASEEQLAQWTTNRAGQSTKVSYPTHGLASLTKIEMITLKIQEQLNDITIIDENGNSSKLVGHILNVFSDNKFNGTTYIEQPNGTGLRLLDYGEGQKSVYMLQRDGYTVQWLPQVHKGTVNGKAVTFGGYTTVTLRQKPKTVTPVVTPVVAMPVPPPVFIPPPKPSFIPFNSEPPTFSSNLQSINKYSYFYGLDKLLVKSITPNQTGCFISEEIDIGTLYPDTFIQLTAVAPDASNSSIEFYILDSGRQSAILLEGQSEVKNEKIFTGLSTRFTVDTNKPSVIKRNGVVSDVSLAKAMTTSDALYTIDYTPLAGVDYKPYSNLIKVKVILRFYNRTFNAPFVSKISIKKYGGETLWQ